MKVANGNVVDTDGRNLYNGGQYYILPFIPPGSSMDGNGLTLATIGATHSLAVVQSSSATSLGLPVTISDTDGTKIILADENLNMKFIGKSSTWIIVFDQSAKVWYLSADNPAQYPNHQIKKGSFQIQNYQFGYKFVFCNSTCQDVGIYVDSKKNNRLALTGSGYAVTFKIS